MVPDSAPRSVSRPSAADVEAHVIVRHERVRMRPPLKILHLRERCKTFSFSFPPLFPWTTAPTVHVLTHHHPLRHRTSGDPPRAPARPRPSVPPAHRRPQIRKSNSAIWMPAGEKSKSSDNRTEHDKVCTSCSTYRHAPSSCASIGAMLGAMWLPRVHMQRGRRFHWWPKTRRTSKIRQKSDKDQKKKKKPQIPEDRVPPVPPPHATSPETASLGKRTRGRR